MSRREREHYWRWGGCPWCGGEESLSVDLRADTGSWAVHCSACFADGPSARSSDDALQRWASRVAQVCHDTEGVTP